MLKILDYCVITLKGKKHTHTHKFLALGSLALLYYKTEPSVVFITWCWSMNGPYSLCFSNPMKCIISPSLDASFYSVVFLRGTALYLSSHPLMEMCPLGSALVSLLLSPPRKELHAGKLDKVGTAPLQSCPAKRLFHNTELWREGAALSFNGMEAPCSSPVV